MNNASDLLALDSMSHAVSWINLDSAFERGESPDAGYVDSVVSAALLHTVSTNKRWSLYRARLMPVPHELDADPLHCGMMGAPPAELATAGRANPAGTSFFYGALDEKTAIAEMRPWRDARITVARFRASTSYRLVDLSERNGEFPETDPAGWLSFVMGRPFHKDDRLSYKAIQFVVARIRDSGVSGVQYRSAMRPNGINVVLFDGSQLRCVARRLIQVVRVSSLATPLSAWAKA